MNTPQILLLSGVGVDENLSPLGLQNIVHSEGVGANLQDHPLLSIQWHSNTTNSFDNISRNVTLAAQLLEEWETNRTGLFVDVSSNLIGWFRLPSDSSILAEYGDPSAGPTSAHIELYPNVCSPLHSIIKTWASTRTVHTIVLAYSGENTGFSDVS